MTTLTLTVTPAIADEICHALIDAGIRWFENEEAARAGENDLSADSCRSIRESAFAIRAMIREQMEQQMAEQI
jgi:hypothetical protein